MVDEKIWRQLNDEQRRAVELWDASVLVMAPVGTGKTNALVLRAANAMEHGVAPRSILCLSFTNKASRQMKERAAAILGERAEQITARTFHSLCAMILRADAGALGLDADFLVFDDEDTRTLACELALGLGAYCDNRERLGFFLSNALGEARLAMYSARAQRSMDEVFDELRARGAPPSLRLPPTFRFTQFVARYVHALREAHAVDFADLVIGVNRLWTEAPKALERWQRRFQWVQVDEVQDTNLSEYRILSALAASTKRLSFFGDVDQTIYEWRGSAPGELLLRFRSEFAPVEEITFVRNYRSTRSILSACARVVHALEGAVTEEIVAHTDDEGAPVVLHAEPTLEEEGAWIANTIQTLRANDGVRYRDCAVLVRTNFNARDLSATFQRLKLPHLPVENVKFFERVEIKDAMAYLRLLLNRNDTASILRFLARPSKGIGDATLKALRGEPREAGLNLGDLLDPTTYERTDPFAPLLSAWHDGRVVVFDFETTGLDPSVNEICEIAAVRLPPTGSNAEPERFHAYIKTQRPVGDSQAIHGYSDEFLAENGRGAREVVAEFLRFVGDNVLVGHNSLGFDVYFLRAAVRELGLEFTEPANFDTLDLARRLHRSLKRYNLGALCQHFGLKLEHAHEAHSDVEATAALLNVLCARLQETAPVRWAAVTAHAARFAPWAAKLAAWRERMDEERPHELLQRILDESGLAEYYQKDPREARRVEYLKQLVAFCEEIDDATMAPRMAYREVVENVTLATDLDRQANREDKIAILTVHQAKGLEFDNVFVACATDDTFPSLRSKREGRLSEEHRLFYVAVSRARTRLYVSWHERDGRGNRTTPSRYLAYLREPGAR